MIRLKITLVVLISCLAFWACEPSAQTRKNSKESVGASQKKVSDDDRRKEVEAMLLRGEYQHDGSSVLESIGTMDSVPALLYVLEKHPGYDMNAAPRSAESGSAAFYHPGEEAKTPQPTAEKRERKMGYICTYLHAVNALQKITGQDLSEYEDWVKWWDEYQKSGKAHKN